MVMNLNKTLGFSLFWGLSVCDTHILSCSCNSVNFSFTHYFLTVIIISLTDLLWYCSVEAQQCPVSYDNCNSCETKVLFCKSNRCIRETDSCATKI